GIEGCRFIRDFFKQSHHISVGTMPDGRVVDEFPRHDDDDLRAFLAHYRKLRLEQEVTNLKAIMNLVVRESDQKNREFITGLKHDNKEEVTCWWAAVLKNRDGGKVHLSQEQLEGLILNGGVFHHDMEKHDAQWQLLGKASLSKAIAYFNDLVFARTVV